MRDSLKLTDNKQRDLQVACLSLKELFEDDLPLKLIFHPAMKIGIEMSVRFKLSAISNSFLIMIGVS